MAERLGSLAWSIISDVHSQIQNQIPDKPLLTEITRLSALNYVFNSRYSPSDIGIGKRKFPFATLSHQGLRVGISKKEVLQIVSETSLIKSKLPTDSLKTLSSNEFVNLLGWIHSLGSYQLPFSLKKGTLQRTLGAYYTPHEIAEYIVELILKEDLDRIIQNISRDGLSALERMYSLCILDPACGAGVFLTSSLNMLNIYVEYGIKKAQNAGVPTKDIEEFISSKQLTLYGVDLDEGALEVADISLNILSVESKLNIVPNLMRGNSLISFEGLHGNASHNHFFSNPGSISPFEWRKQFPEIFTKEKSGFDYIVMNPPYERLKPNFAEFIRERLIAGNRKIHTDAYEEHKRIIRENTRYFRESEEYELATSYSLNTYLLFLERSIQLVRNGGKIGCIIPSNLLGDVSAQRIRRELLLQNRLRTIDDFPETSRMFQGVTQSVVIMSIEKGGTTDRFEVGFNRSSLQDAIQKKRMRVSVSNILRTMGPSLVIPRINTQGLKLLTKLHTNRSMGEIDSIVIRRGELDLTNNRESLSSQKTNTPLLRGSNISRYTINQNPRTSEFVNMNKFRKTLEKSSRSEHINMHRIACQQVSNMGQRWRLKCAPVKPGTVLANSCNYIAINGTESPNVLEYYLGILNSELLNWRFQVSNFNNHVSIRELQNLPIVEYNMTNPITVELCSSVEELDLPTIEACVFFLYGFTKRQTRLVLAQRKAPAEERARILKQFSKLI